MGELAIGQRATLTRTFAAREVGDDFVPCALVGGLFSTLLGTRLPGRGTNWMKQSLRFCRRARAGEPLTATVEIVRLRPEKQLVNLRVVCCDARGALICEGESLVMAREMA
ncbi:MAG TPA: phosphate acetyltransferase [Polyangia bacterium]|nr:phosphate acetyltransferase [Polyangia bacterium]